MQPNIRLPRKGPWSLETPTYPSVGGLEHLMIRLMMQILRHAIPSTIYYATIFPKVLLGVHVMPELLSSTESLLGALHLDAGSGRD